MLAQFLLLRQQLERAALAKSEEAAFSSNAEISVQPSIKEEQKEVVKAAKSTSSKKRNNLKSA